MKKIVALCGLMCLAGNGLHAQDKLSAFEVAPAVTLRLPIQGDSLNLSGQRFAVKELFNSVDTWRWKETSSQRVSADTAGTLSFAKAQKDFLLYEFSTRLRAERFLKGHLKICSSARFELFINGISKYVKTTAEDSLDAVKPVTVHVRLEPEADYEVVVKLLSSDKDKLLPTWKCELVKDPLFAEVNCHIDPDLKRRFAMCNTVDGNRVRSVSMSADGRYALVSYREKYAETSPRSYAELVEVKSGRVILPSIQESMRWMPHSTKLYYLVQGEQRKNLMTLDPVTMREEVLFKDVPAGYFTWAPTEDYLIYSQTAEGEKVEGPLKRLLHPDDRIPHARNRNYLVKYDLSSGVSERLTYGSHGVHLNDISPDGKKLLCSSSKSDITKCPFSLSTLFEIDLNTLHVDTLVSWDAYLGSGAYSPDGQQLLITGSPSFQGGIGKNCGSHPIANDFDTQAFIMDLASRKIEPISRDFNPSLEFLQWNRADGCIYFNTTDKDGKSIYRYVPREGKFVKLPLQEEVIASFSLPQDNVSMAAYVGGGNKSVGVAYWYDCKKQRSTLLANPMKPVLDQISWGEMKEWNFTASDGTLIEGMMCLPPDFDPAKKYPLIVYYYGGTTPTTRGMTSPYCAQLFASRDYVVYVIQPSGAIGFGQEFSARHVNAWGKRTADEIIEGTRKFCEAHPFVNDKKIGCLGASYGGFMTMYLQTKTDLFAAAASHAGISNVTSYWGEGFWGYSYNSVAAAESYPWRNPSLFTQQGALFNADKINTPLLLLHGTVDTNVPIGESIQLYNALKILGKPVEFITVEGEDHFVLDYKKRVLWHNSIMAWFARWLQDSPAWWNDLYPEKHW